MLETDTPLEQWYWHTLYFDNRIEAAKAQKQIQQSFDEYCDLLPTYNSYSVTFSTNYPFDEAHQLCLSIIIGDVDFVTSFNQPGEDAEDLLNVFRWPRSEESDGVSPKSRKRMAHGLCTLCSVQPRASYGLWCVACKRAHLKCKRVHRKSKVSFTDQLPEPDLCPWLKKLAEIKVLMGWYDDERKYPFFLSIGEIAGTLLRSYAILFALSWFALAFLSPCMAILLSLAVGAVAYWLYEESKA
jgi:hypothetical protein